MIFRGTAEVRDKFTHHSAHEQSLNDKKHVKVHMVFGADFSPPKQNMEIYFEYIYLKEISYGFLLKANFWN